MLFCGTALDWRECLAQHPRELWEEDGLLLFMVGFNFSVGCSVTLNGLYREPSGSKVYVQDTCPSPCISVSVQAPNACRVTLNTSKEIKRNCKCRTDLFTLPSDSSTGQNVEIMFPEMLGFKSLLRILGDTAY